MCCPGTRCASAQWRTAQSPSSPFSCSVASFPHCTATAAYFRTAQVPGETADRSSHLVSFSAATLLRQVSERMPAEQTEDAIPKKGIPQSGLRTQSQIREAYQILQPVGVVAWHDTTCWWLIGSQTHTTICCCKVRSYLVEWKATDPRPTPARLAPHSLPSQVFLSLHQ